MDYVRYLALFGAETTAEQDAACLFLESKGLKFLVHFGYENAEAKAELHPDWMRSQHVGHA